MSYQVRFTREAKEDMERLHGFLVEKDLEAARRARSALAKGVEFLRDFPYACRKAMPDTPFLREMLVPFGHSGYVMLFEIEEKTITILAIRHQREEDYY